MAHKKAGCTYTPPAFLTILFSIFTVPVHSPIPEHPLHPLLTGIIVFPVKPLFSTKVFIGHAAILHQIGY